MAKEGEGDMSLLSDVLEPFRKVINSDPPKDKLSVSEKLNVSDSNQSLKEGITNTVNAKRKSSIGNDILATPPGKRMRTDSDSSNKPVLLPSPWEAKRLKIDLLAAKAQIIKLETRVNHQHTICKEMQILFEEEKGSLMDQHKRDEKAVSDMEDRLQLVKRWEQDLKDDYNEALKQQREAKATWDKEKTELHKQIGDLKDKLLEANVSSKDQLSEMKKDMDELLQALEGAQFEIEILKKEVSKQTSRGEQCTTMRTQLEKQTFELQQVTSKLKELEYERDSYKDWQQQAKTAQKRLCNMAELEKEVGRLRATERSLRDAVCNKLLLEEQVHLLTSRVEALQPAQQELHEVKVKLAAAQALLEEWQGAARAQGVSCPRALSSALSTALQAHLTAAADTAQVHSSLAELNEEVATLKHERDRVTRKLTDLQTVRKNQDSLIHRLQKRLLLITRERDSYRQQLDCYEKELTVSVTEGSAGNSSLLSARIQQLEKSLQGYRDLLEKQDQAQDINVVERLRNEVSRWREEAETARKEVTSLRSQRDALHARIQRIAVHEQHTKVLHLADNPAAEAQKQTQTDLEAAQEEIKRLKTALREGGAGATCTDEVVQLKQQLENSQIKLKRMKEEFTSAAQEFREACFTLMGYKMDKTGHKIYKLTNLYAESSDEYLTFTLSNEGVEMVHTDYSETLTDLVELHLNQHRSIPMFLSSLTMELFARSNSMDADMQ